MPRLAICCFALCVFLATSPTQAQVPSDSRLNSITNNKVIRVAYRADAAPFSFVSEKQEPVGYTIDLCRLVVRSIAQQLGLQELKIQWIPVTVQTRFSIVAGAKADMECGSSTVTLGRMKEVDFSSFIFVETTGVVVPALLKATSVADMAGK